MSIQKITYQPEISYYVIAIASILKDYRMSFFINQDLHLNLEKQEDLKTQEKGVSAAFSKYSFFDTNSEFEYFLIQNKNVNQLYIKSLKNFDFLFIIKTIDEDSIDLGSFTERIKAMTDVQLVMEVLNLKGADKKKLEKDF